MLGLLLSSRKMVPDKMMYFLSLNSSGMSACSARKRTASERPKLALSATARSRISGPWIEFLSPSKQGTNFKSSTLIRLGRTSSTTSQPVGISSGQRISAGKKVLPACFPSRKACKPSRLTRSDRIWSPNSNNCSNVTLLTTLSSPIGRQLSTEHHLMHNTIADTPTSKIARNHSQPNFYLFG
jgi:hypothetical protein